MERKTICLLRTQSSSVSKALWPVSLQKRVLTNRSSQRRRQLIMHGFGWLMPSSLLAMLPPPRLLDIGIHLLRLRTIHITLALVAGCFVQFMCMFYNWSILLVLTAMCTTTTLIVIHLISAPLSATTTKASVDRQIPPPAPPATTLPVSAPSLLMQLEHSIPTSLPSSSLPSTLSAFPETPMPEAPLVRVLETIDLSSSDVRHFLDVPTTLPDAPLSEKASAQSAPEEHA